MYFHSQVKLICRQLAVTALQWTTKKQHNFFFFFSLGKTMKWPNNIYFKKQEWLFHIMDKNKLKMYHAEVSRIVSRISVCHHQGTLLPQLCCASPLKSTPSTKTRQFTYMLYHLDFVIWIIACFFPGTVLISPNPRWNYNYFI